jgi:hypothetical protein
LFRTKYKKKKSRGAVGEVSVLYSSMILAN